MGRNGSLREMQSGISSHQSTRPNGMRYLLTKNRILSGLRSLRNSPLAFPPPNGNSKKDTPKSTPVTINKAPPLPPLPAKSKKEINVISKYFHPKNPSTNKTDRSTNLQTNKSYAQASKTMTNTSDVLKIKETFSALNAKKIDQVNDIVYRQSKLKPCIKMTTKGPSRKHIIIPMSSDNAASFMKNSLLNVANINRELRNAKTKVLVGYI